MANPIEAVGETVSTGFSPLSLAKLFGSLFGGGDSSAQDQTKLILDYLNQKQLTENSYLSNAAGFLQSQVPLIQKSLSDYSSGIGSHQITNNPNSALATFRAISNGSLDVQPGGILQDVNRVQAAKGQLESGRTAQLDASALVNLQQQNAATRVAGAQGAAGLETQAANLDLQNALSNAQLQYGLAGTTAGLLAQGGDLTPGQAKAKADANQVVLDTGSTLAQNIGSKVFDIDKPAHARTGLENAAYAARQKAIKDSEDAKTANAKFN